MRIPTVGSTNASYDNAYNTTATIHWSNQTNALPVYHWSIMVRPKPALEGAFILTYVSNCPGGEPECQGVDDAVEFRYVVAMTPSAPSTSQTEVSPKCRGEDFMTPMTHLPALPTRAGALLILLALTLPTGLSIAGIATPYGAWRSDVAGHPVCSPASQVSLSFDAQDRALVFYNGGETATPPFPTHA